MGVDDPQIWMSAAELLTMNETLEKGENYEELKEVLPVVNPWDWHLD